MTGRNRRSGVLIHISSLPSRYGIGDLGPEAYRFVDFLKNSGQRIWQILPLTPTKEFCGNSPYVSASAFAGNPLFISPDLLVEDRLLLEEEIRPIPEFPAERVDYPKVASYKESILKKAYRRFNQDDKARENLCSDFHSFINENESWLGPYSHFMSFKEKFEDASWVNWPEPLKNRDASALREKGEKLETEIKYVKFQQFLFFRQWMHLKVHCNKNGIAIMGDLPIYVDHDSADVWSNRHLFKLKEEGERSLVAGVPPDYFSKTGQLWGNPVYNWNEHRKDNFSWWRERVKHNLRMYDMVRLDHFRGLEAYWEVQASERTAVNGQWVTGPGAQLLELLRDDHEELPIIAEDLGTITKKVRELMRNFNLPGMRILQFAFGRKMSENPYAPHNHIAHCAVYTGTHDNNTTRGWFIRDIDSETRERVKAYFGPDINGDNIHMKMIRCALMSVADTAVIPMQDILGLDSSARMNRPGFGKGNWEWRMREGLGLGQRAEYIRELNKLYGRYN